MAATNDSDPRRNRVDPWGDLHAVAARGMFTGNRGCVVDDHEHVVRQCPRRRSDPGRSAHSVPGSWRSAPALHIRRLDRGSAPTKGGHRHHPDTTNLSRSAPKRLRPNPASKRQLEHFGKECLGTFVLRVFENVVGRDCARLSMADNAWPVPERSLPVVAARPRAGAGSSPPCSKAPPAPGAREHGQRPRLSACPAPVAGLR